MEPYSLAPQLILDHHGEVKGVISHSLPEVDPSLNLSCMERMVLEYLAPFNPELHHMSDDATLQAQLTQCESSSRLQEPVTEPSFQPTYVDKSGRSVLHLAIHNHRNDLVKILHQSRVSLDSKTTSGFTPLHMASIRNNTEIVQWLTSWGANVNASSKEGMTPMHFAAYNGNRAMVENLVHEKAHVNVQDHEGRTPLMAACQQGQMSTVETLLRLNADVFRQTKSGKTVLFYAVMKGHQDLVRFLVKENELLLSVPDNKGSTVLRGCVTKGDLLMVKLLCTLGADVDSKANDGTSPLMAATQEGHSDIVEFLLNAGASPTSRDNLGNTVLMYAAHRGHSELVDRLSALEDLVNTANHTGNTPLIAAAGGGDLAIVSVLMDKGARVDNQNSDGISALMTAAGEGHYDVVKYLVKLGATVTLKTQNGLTAAQIAEAKACGTVVEYLHSRDQGPLYLSEAEVGAALFLAIETGNIPMMSKLMQHNPNVNWADQQGVTLLMQACLKQEVEAVKMLLKHKADIYRENINGMTAVAYALQASNRHIVDWLVAHGASLNEKDAGGCTLLHNAAAGGEKEIVERLERLGVNIDARDSQGKTAVMLASENGFTDVVTYLINCGADIALASSTGADACELAFLSGHHNIVKILNERKSKCYTDVEYSDMARALVRACREADVTKATHLIQETPQLANWRDAKQDGKALLHIASERGVLQIILQLLKHGTEVNIRSFSGKTAIRQASFHGHLAAVKLLISFKANVNIADYDGRTPLMCAAQEGYVEIVEVLIQSGCLINPFDKLGGLTALTFSLKQYHIDIVHMLLENHANPDVKDKQGHTPLSKKCLKGHLDVVKLLTKYGADVNNLDYSGRTPLMAASRSGNLDIAKFLVSQGADPLIRADRNETAIGYARNNRHYEIVEFLEDVASETSGRSGERQTRTYRKSGMDENYRADDQSKEKIIQLGTLQSILRDGEHDTSRNKSETKSVKSVNERIKVALMEGSVDSVEELLVAGAGVNYQDLDGCTLLMYAVQRADLPMIKKLLHFKADIQLADKKGNDAFQYASDNPAVMSALIEFVTGCEGADDAFDTSKSTACENREHKDGNVKTPTEKQVGNFFYAVRAGNVDHVKDCLELGHVTHSVDSEHRNAVFHCSFSQTPRAVEILDMLHCCNINLNCTDVHGTTPLLNSVLANNDPVTMRLLELDADVNTANQYGESPLIECCIRNKVHVLALIFQRRHAKLNQSVLLNTLIFVLVNNLDPLSEVFEARLGSLDVLWQCDVLVLYRLSTYNPRVLERLLPTCDLQTHQSHAVQLLAHLLEEGMATLDTEELRQLLLPLAKMTFSAEGTIDTRYQLVSIDSKAGVIGLGTKDGKDDTADKGALAAAEVSDQSIHPLLPTVLLSHESDEDAFLQEIMQEFTEFTESVQQLVNGVYRIFTSAVVQHSPKCIKGFSKDQSLAKIYVYVPEGGRCDAEGFVKAEITDKNSCTSQISFEYVTMRTEARFLMGDNIPTPAGISLPPTVQGGSAVVEVTRDKYRELEGRGGSSGDGSAVDLVREVTPCGSLTCFMSDTEGSIWGVTAGHTFQNDSDQGQIPQQDKLMVSQIGDHKRVCLLSESKHTSSDLAVIDKVPKFVDVTVFPVSPKCREEELYTLQIPHLETSPKLFVGNNKELLHRKIVKIGAATGLTTGQVIDVDHTTTLGPQLCSGLFLVIPQSDVAPFAQPGDSGASVFDPDSGQVIGLVCASVEKYFILGQWYHHVVFGVRLDYCLQHVQEIYGIALRFTEDQQTGAEEGNEITTESRAGNFEQVLDSVQTRCQELEAENTELKHSLKEAEVKLQLKQKQETIKETTNHKAFSKDMVSIKRCDPGDLVVVCWEEQYENYLVLTVEQPLLHFLHKACWERLGLNAVPGKPRKSRVLAQVLDKELCHAKKPQNRYRVPVDTKFYRVRCEPWPHDIVHHGQFATSRGQIRTQLNLNLDTVNVINSQCLTNH